MSPKKDYKKPFIYSAGMAILAYSVGLFAIGQGAGTEGYTDFNFIFVPLALVEIIATPVSLILGFIYLFRTPSPDTKLKIGLTLIVVAALSSLTIIIF